MGRTTFPLNIPAGIVKSAGKIEARNRYIDADKIRFRDGNPEKIGGWAKITDTPLTGTSRAARAWNDNDGTTVTAVGTTSRLYTLDVDNALVDITPKLHRWRLSPAFATTNLSQTVTVWHPGHGYAIGTSVTFSNVSGTVGGLTMTGTWTIASTPTADTWTFTHSSPASSTSDYDAEATVVYTITLATDPFACVLSSTTVTVTHAAHNAIVGQTVTFSGATAGSGITIDGSYVIVSVPSASTYTITHSVAATITDSSNGGSAVTAVYDLPPGDVDPAGGYGWGIGPYGAEAYGTPRSATSIYAQPHYWSLTNFGRFLMAVPYEGRLYMWDPQQNPMVAAEAVAGAPGAMRGIFITPERFLVAWGASEDESQVVDPMLLRWCSQADYTSWIPDEFNTANSRALTEGKQIMAAGVLAESMSMVWTDTACYTMRYTGSRYVYETRLAGTNAGCSGPAAWCEAHGRAFWYGSGRFYTYAGGIDAVPGQDAILPWVQDNVRPEYLTKTVCFYNPVFNEVWWLFVTGAETEPDTYVIYNLSDASWVTGTLDRTAAYLSGSGGSLRPNLIGADGYIYTHESGEDADGVAMTAYLESGPFQLEEGEGLVNIVGYVPDFSHRTGDVTVTLKARDRAAGSVIDTDILTYDDDTEDGILDARIRGRVVSVRLEQAELNGTFGIGQHALQIGTGGNKR